MDGEPVSWTVPEKSACIGVSQLLSYNWAALSDIYTCIYIYLSGTCARYR